VGQVVSEQRKLLQELAAEYENIQRLPDPETCRYFRRRVRASQRSVAKAAGVTVMTVSRWENGSRTPRGETLARYLDVLDQLEEMAS
jgi:transcriptional regulator with XRE-family HTH domain